MRRATKQCIKANVTLVTIIEAGFVDDGLTKLGVTPSGGVKLGA